MINGDVFIFGAPAVHLPGWQSGSAHRIMPENGSAAPHPHANLIDAALGPLEGKRERLQLWAHSGATRVLSASTTATVAAQESWVSARMHIVGIDPLLMAAGGQTVTVAGANAGDLEWLQSLWPDRTFVGVADAIGQVFSREILPIVNEAVDFVARGVPQDDIDRGTKLGLNYPKGPLEWAELFGWDAVYWGLAALADMYGPRFRPHPWIRAQVGSSLLKPNN